MSAITNTLAEAAWVAFYGGFTGWLIIRVLTE